MDEQQLVELGRAVFAARLQRQRPKARSGMDALDLASQRRGQPAVTKRRAKPKKGGRKRPAASAARSNRSKQPVDGNPPDSPFHDPATRPHFMQNVDRLQVPHTHAHTSQRTPASAHYTHALARPTSALIHTASMIHTADMAG